MYWNGYCLYALMCFTTHLIKLDIGEGFCSFYQSEDVNKKSLVIDLSKQNNELTYQCMAKGPYHTILIYAPGGSSDSFHPIAFSSYSLHYEHLIVLNGAMPMNLSPQSGKGKLDAISLTVHKNANLMKWRWLKNTRFKYIRIDSCPMVIEEGERLDELILSERLLTLTLVNLQDIDLWTDLDYKLAPNLRELSINYCEIFMLKQFPSSSLQKLTRLNLANNKISILMEDFFGSLPKLEVLILEGNQLTNIQLPLTIQLKGLHLDDNPIDGDEETCEFLRSASFVHYKMTDKICPDKKSQRKISSEF